MTIRIPSKILRNILFDDCEDGIVVRDTITDTSRWSEHHDLVFSYKDKLYRTSYSQGLTEYQDERPWEYEDMVECTEVEPYEKTITDYRPI